MTPVARLAAVNDRAYVEAIRSLMTMNANPSSVHVVRIDDAKLATAVLNDTTALNKAAIFDKPMIKEATIEAVLAASFLVGARDESVLAVVGLEESAAFKSFRKAGSWAIYILRKPFELLTEIYKMLRQTEVAA